MQVHFQLNTLKKGNSSIANYYQKYQALTDTLSSIGQSLTNIQMQSFLLGGLGSEYDPFVTSVTTQIERLWIEEIYGHLLSHEMCLEQHHNLIDLSIPRANVADRNYPPCGGRGGRHNYQGFQFGSSSHSFRGRGCESSHGASSSRSTSNNHSLS
jgi:hypothetical protein